jgi:hypothetical protein
MVFFLKSDDFDITESAKLSLNFKHFKEETDLYLSDGKGCNNDKKAIIEDIVLPCRPTCKNPVQEYCDENELKPGCVCGYGYILSRPGGKCIPKDKCPGMYPNLCVVIFTPVLC